MMANPCKYKLMVIAPTCFYYQSHLFKDLSSNDRLDLTVYFCTDEGLTGQDVKIAYGTNQTWAPPDEILSGYKHKFLRNFAPRGSYLKSLVGLANFGIWGEIRRERPDAVVVTSWMNPTWWLVFLACAKFNIPMLFMTDANFYAEKPKSSWKLWLKRIFLGNLIFPNTSGFLYSGTANRLLYKYYGVPSEKLFPFAYSWGYDKLVDVSSQVVITKKEVRKQYGVPQDAVVILYCGRLSSEKGITELIEAYRIVSHPKKSLILVGDGQLRGPLEELAVRHKVESIHFMGFQRRDDVGQFYIMADFFVLPSQKETWGMVINEALSYGLPVIASDQVGAAVDLVASGENGDIFPSGDVTELANQISRMINLTDEERQKMGNNSQNKIKQWNDRDLSGLMAEYLDIIYQART